MALAGEAAYPLAVTAMEQCGIDIRKHRARLLDSEILSEADLVFVMKNAQKSKLEAKYRGVRGRVFRLGEWDGFDIDDPTEMNREAFEQMRKLIEQACTSWVHTFTPLR
jgi:protein-tyrosine phosphatase